MATDTLNFQMLHGIIAKIGGGYMELYASDMFFRGDNEKEQAYDCCIHGNIVFKIGDNLLSDNTEWCVSASAYRFLHTLFENHFMGTEEFAQSLR
jgi:hypothetical protein